MDALPEEGLPDEGQDREAAAELAEMAAALASAAAPSEAGSDEPVDGPTAAVASEEPLAAGGRLSSLRRRLPRIEIRGLNPRRWARPAYQLDGRRSGRQAAGLFLAAALVLAFSSSASPQPRQTPIPTPSNVAVADPTATPSAVASTPAASAMSPEPTASAAATPSQSAGPSPVAAAQTSPTASITFSNLVVDSALDYPHSARVFTFTSDGPGAVVAQVTASSPLDSSELCVTENAAPARCDVGATPSVTLIATGLHDNWKVAAFSGGTGSAIVDLQFSWPTDSPRITVAHARFQGFPNSDSLRGLTATFRTRSAGSLRFAAAWPGTTAPTTITLTDTAGRRQATVDRLSSPEPRPLIAYSHPLGDGHTYTIGLFNDGQDGARPDLTATISFP